ncbi:hypothetical protein QR680_016820 [Steinernema hermaphroditum]|uniref:Uncharacterized protein n=1 Tax=Steinernema hermaphroditum TaxID=289476 RepID=A0AA39LN22_9BILA|nr:hypothetical protein QR680_016820 [Steinernema hermaphroditum]
MDLRTSPLTPAMRHTPKKLPAVSPRARTTRPSKPQTRSLLRTNSMEKFSDRDMKLRMTEEKLKVACDGMLKNLDNARKRMTEDLTNVHRVAELEIRQHDAEKMYGELSAELESVQKATEQRINEDLAKIERSKEKVAKLEKIVQQPWHAVNQPVEITHNFIQKFEQDLQRMTEIARIMEEC